MPTRTPLTTQEVVDMFLRMRSSNVRAVPHHEIVDFVRREQRTNPRTADKWVRAALADPESPLALIYTSNGTIIRVTQYHETSGIASSKRLPELGLPDVEPKLTRDGFLDEEDKEVFPESIYWVVLKSVLADWAHTWVDIEQRRADKRREERRAELARFRERYGQDSIRLLRGLVSFAGIDPKVLRVHYDDSEGPLSLGAYMTIDLNDGDRRDQDPDQIALFLDALRKLGVQPQ